MTMRFTDEEVISDQNRDSMRRKVLIMTIAARCGHSFEYSYL